MKKLLETFKTFKKGPEKTVKYQMNICRTVNTNPIFIVKGHTRFVFRASFSGIWFCLVSVLLIYSDCAMCLYATLNSKKGKTWNPRKETVVILIQNSPKRSPFYNDHFSLYPTWPLWRGLTSIGFPGFIEITNKASFWDHLF